MTPGKKHQLRRKVEDLLLQATNEKSHYYVASVMKEFIGCLDEIERLLEEVGNLKMELAEADADREAFGVGAKNAHTEGTVAKNATTQSND
jgi:coenzyme F420-reducing hydrogenase alpha subunit